MFTLLYLRMACTDTRSLPSIQILVLDFVYMYALAYMLYISSLVD